MAQDFADARAARRRPGQLRLRRRRSSRGLSLHRSPLDCHRRSICSSSCGSTPCRCGPPTTARYQEPVVLPAQFPNLLVNGASGIAVGMATNIPPHNLGDVCKACVHLIDDPDATTAQLLDKIKGPDFPLGGKIVTDRRTLRKIYEEGQGSIQRSGRVEARGERSRSARSSSPRSPTASTRAHLKPTSASTSPRASCRRCSI